MKFHSKHLYSVISIMTLLPLLGCTHVGNITETPVLQMGSPLRGLAPKTFAFKEFKDIRRVDDPSIMIKVGVHTYLLDQLPAIFIADRIKKEFERNGHKCVDASSQVKADFIVDGVIFKFSVNNYQRFFEMNQVANTGVKLTINRVSIDSGVFSKSYEGEFNNTSQIATQDKFLLALGQAVLSMLKNMSTDLELIEFIKK
jgi:hypothetical protein